MCGPFSKAADRQVLSLAFIQKGTNRQTLLSSQSSCHEGFGFTVRNAKYFKVSKPFRSQETLIKKMRYLFWSAISYSLNLTWKSICTTFSAYTLIAKNFRKAMSTWISEANHRPNGKAQKASLFFSIHKWNCFSSSPCWGGILLLFLVV